jgi:hypothetical protein
MEMGIPKHLVALIQSLYDNQRAAARWNGQLTGWFDVKIGTRQGCNISSTEYNLYGEDIMRRALEHSKCGVVSGGRKVNNLRYADDTILVTTQEDSMKNIFQEVVAASDVSNMEIHTTKTKGMVVSGRGKQLDITHNGQRLKQVEQFKYLGSIKTATGDCTPEIKARIGMSKAKAVELDNIWKDQHINIVLKMRLMRAMVWSVFLYGAESWTIKVADRNRISSFEMWCWRRMLSVSWKQHRTDESILTQLSVNRELMGRVAKLKLGYFGHVVRGSA